MEKLILFDWGNVLLNSINPSGGYTSKQAAFDSFKQSQIPEEEWEVLYCSDGLWTLQGKYLNLFLSNYMPTENILTLEAAWHQNMKKVPWFEDNLELMNELKREFSNTVDMGILSVCSQLDKALIVRQTGFAAKYFFFSYSMGLRKPDLRIYKNVQTMLNMRGDQILYFDDWKPSVDAAKSCGWNAVCLDGREYNLIKEHIEKFIGFNIDERKMWGKLLIEDTIRSI